MISAWLLRCWDDGADSVHLEGGQLRLLGALCRESAVDSMICRREDCTFSLWKRMLSAVRQRYRYQGYVMPRPRPWFTLEEGIQYLRELAVVEMLYDESFNPDDPHAYDCPDSTQCTPLMWWHLATSCLAEEVKKLSREIQQCKNAKLCSSPAPTNQLAVEDERDGRPSSSALALVEDGYLVPPPSRAPPSIGHPPSPPSNQEREKAKPPALPLCFTICCQKKTWLATNQNSEGLKRGC
uniref:Uncharacterized protein n=1 Tax=Pavo cristatus TaxID=9049 RepID=A0A8C9G1N5_PAVCR